GNLGGHQVPRVIADYSTKSKITAASLFAVGYHYSVPLDKWNITDNACDYLFLGDQSVDFQIPGTLGLIYNHGSWLKHRAQERAYPFIRASEYVSGCECSGKMNFVYACLKDMTSSLIDKLVGDET